MFEKIYYQILSLLIIKTYRSMIVSRLVFIDVITSNWSDVINLEFT